MSCFVIAVLLATQLVVPLAAPETHERAATKILTICGILWINISRLLASYIGIIISWQIIR